MTGSESTRQNLVLVTIDSLRADHCGFLGDDRGLTPEMDAVADDGLAFTNAVAPGPRTPSSVPVTFTGRFLPNDDEFSMEDWQRRQGRIARHMDRHENIAQLLRRLGYDTACVTANPWTTRESNFDAGFDRFVEVSATSDDVSSRQLSDSPLFQAADAGMDALPVDPVGWSEKKEWFAQWPGFYDVVLEQLDGLEEPFFLWVFLLDAHQPYITPRRYRREASLPEMYYAVLRYWHGDSVPDHARRMIARSYRDAIRSVDAFVGRLREDVASHDPAFVLQADHGEALGDHGNFGHPPVLHEENIRVPLAIDTTGQTETVDDQISLRELPDMLIELATTGTVDPDKHTTPIALSRTENGSAVAVRTDRWKYVADENGERLYDLINDPKELEDICENAPEIVDALSTALDRHRFAQRERELISEALQAITSTSGRNL